MALPNLLSVLFRLSEQNGEGDPHAKQDGNRSIGPGFSLGHKFDGLIDETVWIVKDHGFRRSNDNQGAECHEKKRNQQNPLLDVG